MLHTEHLYWLFSRVDYHVTLETSTLSKCLVTHMTLLWFLSAVNSAVLCNKCYMCHVAQHVDRSALKLNFCIDPIASPDGRPSWTSWIYIIYVLVIQGGPKKTAHYTLVHNFAVHIFAKY